MKLLKSLAILTVFAFLVSADLVIANKLFGWELESASEKIGEAVGDTVERLKNSEVRFRIPDIFRSLSENPIPIISGTEDEATEGLDAGFDGSRFHFSDEMYPYYSMLSENGKEIYRQICANATYRKAAFRPVADISVSEMEEIWTAVCYEHPELFWVESSLGCKYNVLGFCTEIDLVFNELEKDFDASYERFHSALRSILENAMRYDSDYQKELYIHDALASMISYDRNAAFNQSAYSALVTGKTVCSGYARAFQYLLVKCGVPCYYCTGDSGGDHVWNIVKLGGEYYNVDLTWDDAIGSYLFFNRNDGDFAASHVRDGMSARLPACAGEVYRNREEIPNGILPSLDGGGRGGIEKEPPVLSEIP